MRIGLLDPRWLEQRDRSIREKQSDDEVYAPGEMGWRLPACSFFYADTKWLRSMRVWEVGRYSL
jgi:hypothetical protein